MYAISCKIEHGHVGFEQCATVADVNTMAAERACASYFTEFTDTSWLHTV